MSEFERYDLDFDKTINYFIDTIKVENTLSKKTLESVNFKKGKFFSFLLKGISNPDAHFFLGREMKYPPIEFFYTFILQKMQKNRQLTCVFDDCISDFEDGMEDPLFYKFGRYYQKEVYSVIDELILSIKLIEKAYDYSDVLWHSLGILSQSKITSKPGGQISLNEIESICTNAKYIFTTAYDGEGCVIWEKSDGENS